MKTIGGYFELELSKGSHNYHDTPYAMKSGRASLYHILSEVKPSLVHVPFYTCDTLLEPFAPVGGRYQFYAINDRLEPAEEIYLKDGEYILYVNYMGLKDETVAQLSAKYKDKLIVDCTQAFFMKGNGRSWFFNSCRKFFGVPDGSYIYPPAGITMPVVEDKNERYIYDHLVKRFNGHPSDGYDLFVKNESLAGDGVLAMSRLTEHLLSEVNYDEVARIRRGNFDFLQNRFRDINTFTCATADGVPMCYPLLPDKIADRSVLYAQNIFIPAFWTDVLNRNIDGFEVEKKLSAHLLPVPIDHRYSIQDMEVLCNAIEGIL